MAMTYSLNSYVVVTVTDKGERILQEHREELAKTSPHCDWEDFRNPKDGKLRIQLWEAMKLFGPHMGMGFDLVISTVIELEGTE